MVLKNIIRLKPRQTVEGQTQSFKNWEIRYTITSDAHVQKSVALM